MTADENARPRDIALENRETEGEKLYSPSAARNRDAIREVILAQMPRTGTILEVGGGTGEHAIHLASALPDLEWRTGDPDATSRASIAAWIKASKLSNLHGPHAINVSTEIWGIEDFVPFAGLVSINMIHIAPFDAATGLFAGAGRLLGSGGKLFLYGPFSRKGVHTAPSNEAFDASLKTRNNAWGVRDIEHDLAPLAQKHALTLDTVVEMPANNLSLIFRRS